MDIQSLKFITHEILKVFSKKIHQKTTTKLYRKTTLALFLSNPMNVTLNLKPRNTIGRIGCKLSSLKTSL